MTIKELIERLKEYRGGARAKFYVPTEQQFYYTVFGPETRSRGWYEGVYIDLDNNPSVYVPALSYNELISCLSAKNPDDRIVVFLNDDHSKFYEPI
jgi:hypothetical protein